MGVFVGMDCAISLVFRIVGCEYCTTITCLKMCRIIILSLDKV